MKIRKTKMKLSSKLFLLFITLTIISVIIIAVYINLNSRRKLRSMAAGQFGIQQLMQTRLVASAIENYFDHFISNLYFMANANQILSSRSSQDALFYKLYDKLQNVTSIRFVSINGILTFIYPSEGFRRELIGKNYGTEKFYKKTIATGKISISSLLYNEENKPRIRIAIPVFDNDQATPHIKGVLVGSFDPMNVLNSIINSIISDKTGYAWILDSKGNFLTHPVKEFEGKSSFGAREKKNPAFSYKKIEIIQQKMIQGHEGTDTYTSGWHREQKGYIEKFVAYAPVKTADSNWSIAICSPMNALDEIIEETERYEHYTLFFIVFIFLTGGILLFKNSYQRYCSFEQSLKLNEQKLSAITQASPIGICLVKQRKIYWANETLHTMFGYDYDDLIGKNVRMFYQNDSSYLRIGKALYSDFSELKPSQLTSQCIKKDGTIFHCSLRSCPLNSSDLSEGFIVVVGDITERVAVEQENNRLKDHIIRTQRMEAIGILASGIAHDFNNILFPITGYVEILLLDTAENSDTHEYLMNILKASNRAKELINQILSFSRKAEKETNPVLVQPIIKETLKFLKKTIPTTINIVQQIDMNCRPIMADSTQIHQVIMNLCTNAYQAMEDRGGTLTVKLFESEIKEDDLNNLLDLKPGRYLELLISDTGIGMKKNIALKIFEPYFTTKKSGKGTGLGLAVAHGIVKKAGGDIKVISKPYKGTCFHIYLPLIDSNTDNSSLPVIKNNCIKGTGHILLVDDEEQIVAMEQKFLKRLGYDTTACTSSIKALEIFKTNPNKFDLVITDLTMPEITGDKLVEEIKKRNPDVPVIICTGFKRTYTKEWMDSINAQELLIKPVKMKDLSTLISKTINGNR
ncbi:hybrid sensor histidine kinase/response regulator [Desulfobacula toluolica]|uniref:histidine kinase n=1 Tax=Desulfobacula toluolica (strain DSM 7467 / Tol2) TaxID=651182 RepID=K0N1X9_DESTT|nr:cache domain-containing protein [Desulfobacula toluolica]CCK78174.1 putative sensor histidine kinase [Desulfobacula toluolica Tol2]